MKRMRLTEDHLKDIEYALKAQEDEQMTVTAGIIYQLLNEIRTCWRDIYEARASAVQWVTYDGKENKLPKEGKEIILILYKGRRAPRIARVVSSGKFIEKPYWNMPSSDPDVQIGDRWAYLPATQEVME